MFIESWLAAIKKKMWQYCLPLFATHNGSNGEIYNYYGVYFSDVKQNKYHLIAAEGDTAIVAKWRQPHGYSEKRRFDLEQLESMQTAIIHWRKSGPLRFDSIVAFFIHHFTRLAYLKNGLARCKSRIFSRVADRNELIGLDRIALLKMLVKDYAQASADKTHPGVSLNEVIDLLYENLWYQHIKNETFRRKAALLLQSLVITEDLRLQDHRYYVEGKAISTIVAWENEARRNRQQLRMQRNINRLTIIITASTLMITLAILAQAGIVDLHRLWQAILQLKPMRLLLKMI